MSRLAEVVFLSQAWAEAYLPRPDEAMISITDRGKPEADLNPGWAATLRLAFDDIDPVASPWEPGDGALVAMSPGQAWQIADFVAQVAGTASVIAVHCRYGQSRSAGVAQAIAQHHGLAFPPGYRHANQHVHQLVLSALQQCSTV